MSAEWRPTEPLVGRETELSRLLAATGVADPEARGGVLLSGDAGIGKTRLLRELAVLAADGGHRVMVGHCVDLGDSAIPFQPFAEMLAGLDDATRTSMSDAMPPLGPLMWGAADGAGVDRGELFSSVVTALELLGASRPVLLIVEDAHWADASTRHLIRYVLSQRYEGDVRVVVSYRSDDLHRRHPLRADVAEWSRLPGVQRLDLGPLADDEVRALVRSRDAGAIGASGLAAILRRAEGNAFIVEELLDVDDKNGPLPPTLADLLLVRLDRLDDAGRHVVRALACAVGEVSDELLSAVVDLPPSTIEDGVRAALDHRILSRTRSDGYVFRHALLAEVVRDDLLPAERRRIHAAYVKVLSGRGDSADVARHAFEAGLDEVAFTASVRAAERATRVAGHDEAADHYERAFSVVSAAPEGTDVVGLVIAASEAKTAAGYVRRAWVLVGDFLEQADDLPVEDRARLLVAYGTAALMADRIVEPRQALEELFVLVPEQPTALRASVEELAARAASNERHFDEAIRWATQAMTLGQRLGLNRLVADAAATKARARARIGDDPEGDERRFLEVAKIAATEGDVVAELRARHHLAFYYHERGMLDRAEAEFLRTMKTAVQAGRQWAPYGFDGRFFASVTAYLLGHWDLVLELCDVGMLQPPKVPAADLEAVGLLVSAGRGDGAALRTAERLRALWHKDIVLAIHCATAAIDLARDAGEATRWHDDLVMTLTQDWDGEFVPARLRMGGLLVGRLADEAGHASTAERSEWLTRAEQLRAVADHVIEQRGPFGPEGAAWSLRLDAEILRLRWIVGGEVALPALLTAWRETTQAFAELGQVYEEARSASRLAAVLQASGDVAGAKEVASSAHEQAVALGAAPLTRVLEQLAGSTTAAATSAASKPHVAGEKPLTAREREVLEHLVEGRTNGEIATLLFISTKTVSVHVSNILAKLGASTRTEAAAIARRQRA
ncbi:MULTISPECIES: helix-turn-helix transcriptional regulator [Mumia]|uniref:helix-turn-helix transcriptional regulator n=1 Tax=Mumia TaxID=1546255 RepID=UPI001423929A|nr:MULTISPECIES: AAA family ATPase [unclassified Mumia]QMW67393.1 AAA family ATPase [Mumia sp. ZJ1417]